MGIFDNLPKENQGVKIQPEKAKRVVLRDIFDYLRKLSPGTGFSAEKLTSATLRVAEYFNRTKRMSWEVIQRYEGALGTEGALGSFRFEYSLNKNVIHELSNETDIEKEGTQPHRIMSGAVKNLFKVGVAEAAKTHLQTKYLSEDISTDFEELDTYPAREKGAKSTVRLIVPRGHDMGFVDVELGEMDSLFEERLLRGNEVEASQIELLLLGGNTDILLGPVHGRVVRPMSQWEEEVGSEPPWMVLSMSAAKERTRRVRDPRIFAHMNVALNERGVPDRITFDHGHVGSWGEDAEELHTRILSGALNPAVARSDEDGAMETGRVDVKEIVADVSTRLDSFEHTIGGDLRAVFWEQPLLYDLAKKLDVFQVDSRLVIPDFIANYLRKNSREWGGNVGRNNLSLLLSEGQAPFFMVAKKDVDNPDLQVGLGVGGIELYAQLTSLISRLSFEPNLAKWTKEDKEGLQHFVEYWRNAGWRQAFVDERERAAHDGLASISTLAAMTGPLRNIVEGLADRVVPGWASLMKNRTQVSSLGKVSEQLTGIVEKVTFYTAGSKNTGEVVGIKENIATLQMYAKDPVLWLETAISIVRNEGEGVVRSIKKNAKAVLQELNFSSETDRRALENIVEWLELISRGVSVENAGFSKAFSTDPGRSMDVPIETYIRLTGEDNNTRNEVHAHALAMAQVLERAMKNASIDEQFYAIIRNNMKDVALKKQLRIMAYEIQLAAIDHMIKVEGVNTEDLQEMLLLAAQIHRYVDKNPPKPKPGPDPKFGGEKNAILPKKTITTYPKLMGQTVVVRRPVNHNAEVSHLYDPIYRLREELKTD